MSLYLSEKKDLENDSWKHQTESKANKQYASGSPVHYGRYKKVNVSTPQKNQKNFQRVPRRLGMSNLNESEHITMKS